MDLHSKMTMYFTSTMTSPVTKTAKTSKWLRLNTVQHSEELIFNIFQCRNSLLVWFILDIAKMNSLYQIC